ncbi:MAG: hypothetical protein ACR2HJ_04530 [Fimbriimonadales bacterium]
MNLVGGKRLSDVRDEKGASTLVIDGIEILSLLHIPVTGASVITLSLKTGSGATLQGCSFKANGGKFVVKGKDYKGFFAWSDTLPEVAEFEYRPGRKIPKEGFLITVANAWIQGGTPWKHIGNSGMIVESFVLDEGRQWICRCSDGIGEVNFDDLRIEIMVTP